jgi:hypothetical protein
MEQAAPGSWVSANPHTADALLQALISDFAEYCAALRTRYRQQINRSIRKLKDPGIRQAILTDAKEISRLYTAEVHCLYARWPPRPMPSLKSFRLSSSDN